MGEKRRTDYTMGEVMEICKGHVETCAKCPFLVENDGTCSVFCFPRNWALAHVPALSDNERQLLKCLEGVKYVSRDGGNSSFCRWIYLWAKKPRKRDTGAFESSVCEDIVGRLDTVLLPSIGPGECWSVEELL